MAGATTGNVRLVLGLEGLFVFVTALLAYNKFGEGWKVFSYWILMPDISFFGYIWGKKVGAVAYNAAHSYIGALACLTAGLAFSNDDMICASIIWCAHIGFDRLLGYGLKYSEGFSFTHLGRIGRLRSQEP